MRRSTCATPALPMRVGPFAFRYQGNRATPCQYIDNTRKTIVLQRCHREFLYNETLQQDFSSFIVEIVQNTTNIGIIYPHFEEVRGGVEPWSMARLKACVKFLLSVVELLFISLTVQALQGKMCQNSLLSGGVGHLEPRFPGEGVVPGEYFLVSTKLDTFCYQTVQTAPCYVPSF